MSAGILKFTLGLDSGQFTRGMEGANQGTINLILNMERASNSSRHMTTGLVHGFREAKEGVKSTDELMRAFIGSAEMLGFSTFPRLTAGIEVAVQAIKGLGGAARVTGLGFGGLGVAVLGVAAAVGILTSGYEALQAQMEEMKSADALDEQYDVLKEKLIPMLEKAMKLGRLDIKTGVGLENLLNGANDPESKRAAIKAAQAPLSQIAKEDRQFVSGQSLNQMMTGLSHQFLLSGPARDKALFSDELDGKLQAALKLAHDAGKPEQPIVDQFNKIKAAKYAEIDASYDSKDKSPKLPHQLLSPEHIVSLQQMGLVLRGGAGQGADSSANIARNTAELVALTRKLLSKEGGTFSLQNSFAI